MNMNIENGIGLEHSLPCSCSSLLEKLFTNFKSYYIRAQFPFSFERCMYVRFASGLLKEGLALLHWSTLVILLAYSCHSAFMHPLRSFVQKNNTCAQ